MNIKKALEVLDNKIKGIKNLSTVNYHEESLIVKVSDLRAVLLALSDNQTENCDNNKNSFKHSWSAMYGGFFCDKCGIIKTKEDVVEKDPIVEVYKKYQKDIDSLSAQNMNLNYTYDYLNKLNDVAIAIKKHVESKIKFK